MNFKKRTEAEMNESEKKRDYTGGYEYLPWLFYMRISQVIPMLIMFLGGSYYATQEGTFWLGVSGIFVSFLIKFMLRRDYISLQKGQVH
jgi:hypothetical protein